MSEALVVLNIAGDITTVTYPNYDMAYAHVEEVNELAESGLIMGGESISAEIVEPEDYGQPLVDYIAYSAELGHRLEQNGYERRYGEWYENEDADDDDGMTLTAAVQHAQENGRWEEL